MTADGQKAHKDVAANHAVVENNQAASARLQSDATQGAGPLAAKLTDAGGERILQVAVRPHDTLRNIGRELYLRYGHHEASVAELKAFELDAGQRNGLSKAARDNLQPNQELKLTLPGLTLPKPELAHPKPQVATAKAHIETAKPNTREAQAIMKGAASCSVASTPVFSRRTCRPARIRATGATRASSIRIDMSLHPRPLTTTQTGPRRSGWRTARSRKSPSPSRTGATGR